MAQPTNNIFDTALIFEGGGMRASYTCALANVLNEQGLHFDNVYGVSAGASNSVNYISRDLNRTRRSFVEIVNDPKFGGASTMLQGKGYFSAEHIYEESGKPGEFLPFDMQAFLDNPAHVTIESFQRDTGKTVYWTKEDMGTLGDLMVRVRASSTLPVVMPSPKIDDAYYYDGGLGEGAGFLLPRAKHDGFTRFFIVRTRPRAYRKKPSSTLSTAAMNVLYWARPKVTRALRDRWWKYNRICKEIEQLEAAGNAYVFYAENMNVDSGEKDFDKLERSYEMGYQQAIDELPKMMAFLEKPIV